MKTAPNISDTVYFAALTAAGAWLMLCVLVDLLAGHHAALLCLFGGPTALFTLIAIANFFRRRP